MQSLPHEAKVVVIGGGIAGCSAAYHLADNGWNTVLIEPNFLGKKPDFIDFAFKTIEEALLFFVVRQKFRNDFN